MASMDFESWLSASLNAVGADGDVFSGYICGTLDALSSEEVLECVLDILEGCIEEDGERVSLGKEIEKEWIKEKERRNTVKKDDLKEVIVVPEEGLSVVGRDLTVGSKESSISAGLSSEEKMMLIAQYDCESDDDPSTYPEDGDGHAEGLFVNCNVGVVTDAQKLHRDILKSEHEMKVERDRRNKEIQKQRIQEKKVKEKKRTQKQEKRR